MKMKDFMMKLKELWYSFLRLFVHHYKLTVSYNHIYGDADDVVYEVKKFYKKQDKYLYFKNRNNSGYFAFFRNNFHLPHFVNISPSDFMIDPVAFKHVDPMPAQWISHMINIRPIVTVEL